MATTYRLVNTIDADRLPQLMELYPGECGGREQFYELGLHATAFERCADAPRHVIMSKQ